MPRDLSTYLHRVGRTGRFGTRGLSVLLLWNHELQSAQQLLANLHTFVQPLPLECASLDEVSSGGCSTGGDFSSNSKGGLKTDSSVRFTISAATADTRAYGDDLARTSAQCTVKDAFGAARNVEVATCRTPHEPHKPAFDRLGRANKQAACAQQTRPACSPDSHWHVMDVEEAPLSDAKLASVARTINRGGPSYYGTHVSNSALETALEAARRRGRRRGMQEAHRKARQRHGLDADHL